MQRWSTLSLGITEVFFRQGTATDGEPVSELPLVAAVAAAWDKDALAKEDLQILRRVSCTLDQLAMTCWKVGGWAPGLCWGALLELSIQELQEYLSDISPPSLADPQPPEAVHRGSQGSEPRYGACPRSSAVFRFPTAGIDGIPASWWRCHAHPRDRHGTPG